VVGFLCFYLFNKNVEKKASDIRKSTMVLPFVSGILLVKAL